MIYVLYIEPRRTDKQEECKRKDRCIFMRKKSLSIFVALTILLAMLTPIEPQMVFATGGSYVWNFASNGDSQGWALTHSLNGSVSGGTYNLTVTGNDPNMMSPDNLSMSASTYKILRIRMKNNTSDAVGAIYWTTTTDGTWDVNKAQGFIINANDGNYTEYTVNLSANPRWTGTIKQIRIDPVNDSATSGTVNVDYILMDTAPITCNFDTNGDSQGWTLTHSLSGSVSGGSYNLTVTGIDPNMMSPDNLNMNASTCKYIKIRMKNNTSDAVGAIYWITTADTAWDVNKAQGFTINQYDGNYTEYTVDLSANPSWAGTIKQIRIDPVNDTATSGNVNVDYVTAAAALSTWNFNTNGNGEGWNLFNSLSGSVSGDSYNLTITGSDPYMLSPGNLGMDASRYRFLKIRMKNNTPDTTAAIYWTTSSGGGFDSNKSQGFTINANDSNYTEYIVDLSGNQYWTGTIDQIRIDPVNGSTSSGTVNIDYIVMATLQPVSSVTLNYSSITVNPGSTQSLIATVSPANADNKAVTWSSSNLNVAAVDTNGNVTGYTAGTSIITATTVDGGKTASCTVQVPILLNTVMIGSSKTVISPGNTLPLTVTGNMSDGTEASLSQAQIIYSSDNTNAATVNGSGVVSAVANGTANITVSVTLNGVNRQNKIPIVVNSGACFQISTADNQNVSTSTSFTVQGTETGVTKPMWYEVYSNSMSGKLADFGAFAPSPGWTFPVRHLNVGTNLIKVYTVNPGGNTESITITVNLVLSSSPDVRPRPNPAEIWWGGLGQNQQLMENPDQWTFVKKYADAYFFHTYYWANSEHDNVMTSIVNQMKPYGTKYAAELAGDTIAGTPTNPDAWPQFQNTSAGNGGSGPNGWISNKYINTGMALTEATHDFHPDLNLFANNYPTYTQDQLLAKLQQLWNSYFSLNYQYAPQLKHSNTWQPSWWWWQTYPPLGGEKRNSDPGVKFTAYGKLYDFDGFYIIDALRKAAFSIQDHPYWSFIADAPYYVMTWNEGNNEGAALRVKMRTMEQWLHSLGLRFTLVCNEDPGVSLSDSNPDAWDQKYAENSLKSLQLYQSEGGRADRYNFESWYMNTAGTPIPFVVTSEDTQYSYTWLVKQAIKYMKGIKDVSGTLETLTLTQGTANGRTTVTLKNTGDVACMPALVASENGDSRITSKWYDNNSNEITNTIKTDEGWTFTPMLNPGDSVTVSCAVTNPGGTNGKTFSVEAFWNPQDPTGIVRGRTSWTVN